MLDSTLKSFIKTRWNTHVDLLESILKNWEKVKEILQKNQELDRLAHVDESLLHSIVQFLLPFKKATEEVSQTKDPSLYLVWLWSIKLERHLQQNNSDPLIISEMKSEVLPYFKDNMKIHMCHKAAEFLNPTVKSLKFCSPSEKQEIIDYVLDLMPDENEISEIASNNNVSESNSKSSLEEFLDDTSVSTAEMEIQTYINFKMTLNEDFNLLSWWQANKKKNSFPGLFHVAKFIHSIPATSAPSERAFSQSGNVITHKRSQH